jgi:beta-galactosidase
MRKSGTRSGGIAAARMRRRTFLGGAAATGAVLTTSTVWLGACASQKPIERREQLFDEDWLFQRGDVSGAERPDFDDAGWRKLDLPHDWTIEDLPGNLQEPEGWMAPVALWNERQRRAPKPDEGLVRPSKPQQGETDAPLKVGPFDTEMSAGGFNTGWTVGGIGWYRKRFATPEIPKEGHVQLQFDGAFSETEVWLNGAAVGSHAYGYTPLACDLTPHLRPSGENVLAVRIRNEGVNSRWYTGSGIYRHVRLTITGPVRVPLWGVAVTTPAVALDAAQVSVAVDVENRSAVDQPAVVRVTIIDPSGKSAGTAEQSVSLAAGGSGKAQVEVTLPQPAVWSPAKSPLYRAEAVVLVDDRPVDSVATRFGVRQVEIDATRGLRINGEPLKLHGACVHHDNGLLGAAAIDRAEIRKVELLRANGYNAIRCSHNPYSPAFLDACDELGMLVVDEAFDVWEEHKVPDDYAKHFKDNWRKDIAGMVLRDRNHPCVIMWSIGNEIPEKDSPRGVEIAKMLRDEILRLDPTRHITAGLYKAGGPDAEPSRRHLDVAGYNYAAEAYEADHAAHPDLVIMGTEQYASNIHEAWRKVEAYPYVIGDFVWTGIDYLGEVGAGSSQLRSKNTPPKPTLIFLWDYPAFRAGCGEIDMIGLKKPQSHYRDVLWRRSPLELFVQRPVPAGKIEELDKWGWHDELASWTWPEAQGSPMTVRAYTRADEVALLLDGREVARKKLPSDGRLTIEFTVPYEPGELIAIAYTDDKELARKSLVTVGAPAKVRLRTDRVRINRSRNDLAYVHAEVLDAQDRLVPDAALPLVFALRGEGELAAVGAANPRALESFRDSRCHSFHGTALAIVRPLGRTGSAMLRVESPGLEAHELNIEMT